MPSLPASLRRSAERATLELPFRIPAKEWFTLREAAELMGLSESFVEKLYDAGSQLAGHNHNAGAGVRMSKRVPRVWLVAYLTRTATYDDASLADAWLACLPRFPAATLRQVAATATRLAQEKPLSAA